MGESLAMVRCDPWKRIIRKGYIGHGLNVRLLVSPLACFLVVYRYAEIPYLRKINFE